MKNNDYLKEIWNNEEEYLCDKVTMRFLGVEMRDKRFVAVHRGGPLI